MQALADAGGPTDRAGKTVVILRSVGGDQKRMQVNFNDIKKGRRKDVILQDNDTLLLEESLF
jgi:protein involved in polysaccharide export with SLBB domain